MNDYVELQKIYEGYPGAFDPIKPSNYYPAKQDQGPYSRPIPGTPEASGFSQYRKNMVGNKITHIVDEEKPAAQILNRDVVKKIEELQKEADEDGHSYANMLLGRLKEYIEKDLTPKGRP